MNNTHIGKRLRLINYDYSTPGVYFVTFCTKDRRPVLSEILAGSSIDCPPEVSLTHAGAVLDAAICQIPLRYPSVSVKQHIIMPNHVHLLLQLSGDAAPALGRIIQQLKGTVSKQLGTSIWQDKYYDHVIRDENDFLIKYKYISDNPSKWAEDEYYYP
ncbi:MAG: transposase [Oscillospiraceae bacterium]|nr:transposase [Oscillospiraceae bacterium]